MNSRDGQRMESLSNPRLSPGRHDSCRASIPVKGCTLPFYPANEKKDRLLALLDEGLVALHINARHPDVLVPEAHKSNSQLVLNLSYRFRLDDLHISETEVRVTLSFQGSPFLCVLPMEAIWGLSLPNTDEDLELFAESLPLEMLLRFLPHLPPEIYEEVQKILTESGFGGLAPLFTTLAEEEVLQQEDEDFTTETTASPSAAILVEEDMSEDASLLSAEEPEDEVPPSRPALRLVHDSSDALPTVRTPRPKTRSHLRLVTTDKNDDSE